MIKAAQFDNFFDFFHEFRSQVIAGKEFVLQAGTGLAPCSYLGLVVI